MRPGLVQLDDDYLCLSPSVLRLAFQGGAAAASKKTKRLQPQMDQQQSEVDTVADDGSGSATGRFWEQIATYTEEEVCIDGEGEALPVLSAAVSGRWSKLARLTSTLAKQKRREQFIQMKMHNCKEKKFLAKRVLSMCLERGMDKREAHKIAGQSVYHGTSTVYRWFAHYEANGGVFIKQIPAYHKCISN